MARTITGITAAESGYEASFPAALHPVQRMGRGLSVHMDVCGGNGLGQSGVNH